ncbi:MAG TPA: hypothetical protein VLT58_08940 [Polyangia bacterium]|nr:hypothetical protein [Polyangia bacterium]
MSSSPSEPAPGTPADSAESSRPAPRPAGVRNALRARRNPRERSYWQLIPRRNFRLALLLIALIVGVVALKRTGGLSLGHMFDQFAPPVPARKSQGSPPGTFQHMEVRPAPPKRP